MSEADDWGVWVNECGIFASRIGADRWLDFLIRRNGRGVACLGVWPGGGEWHVMCGSKADAAETRDLFLEVGFHRGHVKVARLSACQAKITASRARTDARMAGAVAAGGH